MSASALLMVMCCVRWCDALAPDARHHHHRTTANELAQKPRRTWTPLAAAAAVRGSVAVFFYYLSMNNHWPALFGQFVCSDSCRRSQFWTHLEAAIGSGGGGGQIIVPNEQLRLKVNWREGEGERKRQNCPIIARHHCHHHHHHCLCQSSERKKDDVVVVVEVDDYRRWSLRKRRKEEEKTSCSLSLSLTHYKLTYL